MFSRSQTGLTANILCCCSPDHPFYVFGAGWASLDPALTRARYRLAARQLAPGHCCVSLRQNIQPTRPPAGPPESKQVGRFRYVLEVLVVKEIFLDS